MKKPVKLRRQFWRWHRRTGLFSLVVLVILCITGVALNHSAHLHIDRYKVHSPFVLKAYGIDVPEFSGVKVGDHWATAIAGELYLNGRVLTQCRGRLLGVLHSAASNFWLAACEQELILITPDNEIIEVIDANLGLPTPIKVAGMCDAELCLQHALPGEPVTTYRVDVDALEWLPVSGSTLSPFALTVLPKDQQDFYRPFYAGEDLTWERVVLDIHAARFFGAAGPWVLDFFVVLFLFMSGSGFYLWYTASKKNK